MMVVTIDAAQLDILAVDFKYLTDTFHLLHAQVVVKMFDDVALIVFQFHTKRIEVRFLG